MTLKRCTVTKLDDVFWRVDFDEKISIGSSDLKSPQVVKRFGDRWFFQGFPGDDAGDPDELLRMVGLTRHDEPETVEERVRRLANTCGQCSHWDPSGIDEDLGDCAATERDGDRRTRRVCLDTNPAEWCPGFKQAELRTTRRK